MKIVTSSLFWLFPTKLLESYFQPIKLKHKAFLIYLGIVVKSRMKKLLLKCFGGHQ